jgi:hypothetical protein
MTTTMLHQHDCQDDERIVAQATDLAISRALAAGKQIPTSGPPPKWLVTMIDEAITEVLSGPRCQMHQSDDPACTLNGGGDECSDTWL